MGDRLYEVRYLVHRERGHTQHGTTPQLALTDREAVDVALARLQTTSSGRVVVIGAREVV